MNQKYQEEEFKRLMESKSEFANKFAEAMKNKLVQYYNKGEIKIGEKTGMVSQALRWIGGGVQGLAPGIHVIFEVAAWGAEKIGQKIQENKQKAVMETYGTFDISNSLKNLQETAVKSYFKGIGHTLAQVYEYQIKTLKQDRIDSLVEWLVDRVTKTLEKAHKEEIDSPEAFILRGAVLPGSKNNMDKLMAMMTSGKEKWNIKFFDKVGIYSQNQDSRERKFYLPHNTPTISEKYGFRGQLYYLSVLADRNCAFEEVDDERFQLVDDKTQSQTVASFYQPHYLLVSASEIQKYLEARKSGDEKAKGNFNCYLNKHHFDGKHPVTGICIEARLKGTLASLEEGDFSESIFMGIDFEGINLTSTSFKKAILIGSEFEGSILHGTQFQGAYLEFCNFKNVTLGGETNFQDAELCYANLSALVCEGKVTFINAKLTGAIMTKANFTNAVKDNWKTEGCDLHDVVIPTVEGYLQDLKNEQAKTDKREKKQLKQLENRIKQISAINKEVKKELESMGQSVKRIEIGTDKLVQRYEPPSPEEIKASLRKYYCNNKEESTIKRSLPDLEPLDVTDCFINLSIIEKQKSKEKQEAKATKNILPQLNSNRDQLYSSYEDIYNMAKKKPIKISELFSVGEKSKSTRLFIVGRAGIGKSTLTQRLVYDWAKHTGKSDQNLWENKFEFVFKIKLRKLNSTDKKYKTPAYMIARECFDQQSTRHDLSRLEEGIAHILKTKPEKVLIILDGYDEFDKNSPCATIINWLLSAVENEKIHFLVTSRPYAKLEEQNFTTLECMGFTSEDIQAYVKLPAIWKKERDGSGAALAKEITAFLDQHPHIHSLVHVPILLDIVCAMWEEGNLLKQKQLKTITMSALYETIYDNLWEVYTNKYVEQNLKQKGLEETRNKAKSFLETLAFEAMKTEDLIISLDQVFRAVQAVGYNKEDVRNNLPNLLASGFLYEIDGGYYFPHFTFQEFFAAKYLANAFIDWAEKEPTKKSQIMKRDVILKFLQKEKYNPRYEVVLWFVAGLLKKNEEALVRYLDLLQEKESRDLFGHYEIGLLARCLEESKGDQIATLYQSESHLNEFDPKIKGIHQRIQQSLKDIFYLFEHGMFKYGMLFANYHLSLIRCLQMSPCLLEVKDKGDLLFNVLEPPIGNPELLCKFVGEIGLATDKVITFLLRTFESQEHDFSIHRAAAYALCQLDEKAVATHPKATLALLEKVRKEKEKNSGYIENFRLSAGGRARVSFFNFNIDPKDIPASLESLNEKDAEVRRKAADALGQLGEKAATHPEVIPALLKVLNEKDAGVRVRGSAANALGELGEKAATHPKVIPALLEALNEKDAGVRYEAAYALGQLCKKVATYPEVIPALLKALNEDDDAETRRCAAKALVHLGKKVAMYPEVIPALLKVLNEEDDAEIRHCAANVLGQLGEKATMHPEVIPALLKVLNEEVDVPWVRREAADALGLLGEKAATHPEVIPALLKALNEKDAGVRGSAANALGQLGGKAAMHPEVIPALLKVLNEEVDAPWVRREAANALGRLGEKAFTSLVADPNKWQEMTPTQLVLQISSAYLHGGISCQIILNVQENKCTLQGYAGKEPFEFNLSLDQGKRFAQLVSKVIEQWVTPEKPNILKLQSVAIIASDAFIEKLKTYLQRKNGSFSLTRCVGEKALRIQFIPDLLVLKEEIKDNLSELSKLLQADLDACGLVYQLEPISWENYSLSIIGKSQDLLDEIVILLISVGMRCWGHEANHWQGLFFKPLQKPQLTLPVSERDNTEEKDDTTKVICAVQ